MSQLGHNQCCVLESRVQGPGCEGPGMTVQMLSWGPSLGKEAEFELWVDQREGPPPQHPSCGLLARRALSLFSMVWLGRRYGLGDRVWEDQRLRRDKTQILILAWRKPIPSATLWLADEVGGSQIKGRISRPGQQLPSSWASLAGGVSSGSWFTFSQHWGGPMVGTRQGHFSLKILPVRVSRRNWMTCLRQERGEGRSITSVMRAGVCILPCFLGFSIWILRGKRGLHWFLVLPGVVSSAPPV